MVTKVLLVLFVMLIGIFWGIMLSDDDMYKKVVEVSIRHDEPLLTDPPRVDDEPLLTDLPRVDDEPLLAHPPRIDVTSLKTEYLKEWDGQFRYTVFLC